MKKIIIPENISAEELAGRMQLTNITDIDKVESLQKQCISECGPYCASFNRLETLFGTPVVDERIYSEYHTCCNDGIQWYLHDEYTNATFLISYIDNSNEFSDELYLYWSITTDCITEDSKKLLSKAFYILSSGGGIPVRVLDPVITGTDRYGVNNQFAQDIGMFVGSNELYIELNRDNELYKRFYSKLSPELKEEFNILIKSYMAIQEENRFNYPIHYKHNEHFLNKVNARYTLASNARQRELRKLKDQKPKIHNHS